MEKMIQILKNKKGFTLIELVTIIGIISILAIIAIPIMSKTIPNYQLKGAAREIYSNLQKAKLEAVRQNSDVIMAFTTGTYTADGGVGSYEVSFVDNNGTKVIISSGSMPKTVSLFDDSNECTFTGNTAKFNGQGLPIGFGGSVQVRNSTRWYKITVSSAGNIKLEISSDGTNFSL